MSTSGSDESERVLPKRQRILLLASPEVPESLVIGLNGAASKVRATVRTTSTPGETLEVLENSGESLRLLAIDTRLPDFLIIARRAAEEQPLIEVTLLCPEADIEALRRRLGLAPRLGAHWSIVASDSTHALRALRSAFQRADQRKATRTTLDRFNARITAPAPSVDAGQMRELVISDRFLSSILESNFDAVIIVDTGGRVTTLNPAAETLFGRKAQNLISHPLVQLAGGRWPQDVLPLLALQKEGTSI